MKHTFLKAFFTVICLLFSMGLLGATEVEFYGGIDFLTFDPDLFTAGNEFKPSYKIKDLADYTFLELKIKTEITENVTFDINLIRDNIFKNNMEILLGGKSDYFSFKVGTFAGISDNEIKNLFKGNNDDCKPFLGVMGGIELMYPGVVFLEGSGSYTLNRDWAFTSKHERTGYEAKLGFWLPAAIPSASYSYKSFRTDGIPLSLFDTRTRYQLSVDFYSKIMPLTFRIDSGYQIYERTYDDNDATTADAVDKLSSFFAGFEIKFQVSTNGRLVFGAEVPVPHTDKSNIDAPAFYRMAKTGIGFISTTN